MVAKVHKIAERSNAVSRDRLNDKDTFDVYRILRAVDAEQLAAEFRNMLAHEIAHPVVAEAINLFGEHFGDAAAVGTEMVARYVTNIEYTDFFAASSVVLSRDLLGLLP